MVYEALASDLAASAPPVPVSDSPTETRRQADELTPLVSLSSPPLSPFPVGLPPPGPFAFLLTHFGLCGLRLPSQMSIPTYRTLGAQLRQMQRATQWGLGDYAAYAHQAWGEDGWVIAAQNSGHDEETLRTFARVARAFPPPSRKATIAWAMYAEIARLPENERGKYVREAEDGDLTLLELRAVVALREKSEILSREKNATSQPQTNATAALRGAARKEP